MRNKIVIDAGLDLVLELYPQHTPKLSVCHEGAMPILAILESHKRLFL